MLCGTGSIRLSTTGSLPDPTMLLRRDRVSRSPKLLLEPVGLVAQLQARPLQLLLHGGQEDVVLACSRAVRPALDFLSRTQHQQESQGQATDGVLHIGSAQVYPTPGSIRTKTLQLRSIKKLSFRRHSRDKKSGPISGPQFKRGEG